MIATATRMHGMLPHTEEPDESQSSALSPLVMAEHGIIGAILNDNKIFDEVVSIISEDDFSDPAAKELFKAIGAIFNGEFEDVAIADVATVGMVPGISKVVSTQKLSSIAALSPAIDSVLAYAKIISDAGTERKLNVSVFRAHAALSEDISTQEKSARIAKLFDDAAPSRSVSITSIGDASIAAIRAVIEHSESGKEIIGISTGFHDLDRMTSGFQGGQMIVIAGRPAMGKTSLIMGISDHMTSNLGKHVLFVSLEMSKQDLALRVISLKTGVDVMRLRNGAMTEIEWASVMKEVDALKSSHLNLADTSSTKLQGLRATARKLHREGRLNMIVVDYLQLMGTDSKSDNRTSEISEISRGLKLLAQELDVPVVALSQLNRTLEARADKRPVPSDLRESGAIEQDADLIMFVYRDEVYNKASVDAGVAEIIIGKQRNGPVGTVRLGFSAPTASFLNKVPARSFNQDIPDPLAKIFSKSESRCR